MMETPQYPWGNEEVFNLFWERPFDRERVAFLLSGIDVNNPVSRKLPSSGGSEFVYTTTYLNEAVQVNNLEAVKLLFDLGADPNSIDPDAECPLWDLQFIEDDQDCTERYEIAKQFFFHGADPNLVVDDDDLYSYVLYKVYNDLPSDDNERSNLLNLYRLLVIFGGGGVGYDRPQLGQIDLERIDEYRVSFILSEDGYHVGGYLIGPDEEVIGEL